MYCYEICELCRIIMEYYPVTRIFYAISHFESVRNWGQSYCDGQKISNNFYTILFYSKYIFIIVRQIFVIDHSNDDTETPPKSVDNLCDIFTSLDSGFEDGSSDIIFSNQLMMNDCPRGPLYKRLKNRRGIIIKRTCHLTPSKIQVMRQLLLSLYCWCYHLRK